MSRQKPVILIGPTCDDPTESVSVVNRALVDGLQDRFTFVCSACNRRYGLTRQSRLNLWNLYYLAKHVVIWFNNLLRHRPDIAHYAISSEWAMEKGLMLFGLARLCGARTVGHLHSGGFVEYWQKLSPGRRRFASTQLAKLDAFIVLSEKWGDLMVEKIGIAREKLHVINNPIAASFEDVALAMAIDRQGNRLLSLGTMGRDKGVLELVAACAVVAKETRDFRLDIVGPEREPGIRDLVSRQVKELDLTKQVTLQGSIYGTAKLDLFRETSIFVLPSHFENFPLVVLEAAAAGQAIITTPVGAVPEFFEDGVSAIFVEVGNAVQLAEAITRLISSPGERLRLAAGAREVFRRQLSRAGNMRSLLGVYGEVLREGTATLNPLPSDCRAGGIAASPPARMNQDKLNEKDKPAKKLATTFFTEETEQFAACYERNPAFVDRLNLFQTAVQRSIPAPARVLDFGCGPGVIAAAMAHLGYDVLGTDGSSGMVQKASSIAAAAGLNHLRFELMDATTAEFLTQSFDIIICSSVIEYLPSDMEVLAHLVESLKMGGSLLVSVPNAWSLTGITERSVRCLRRLRPLGFGRHFDCSLRHYSSSRFVDQLASLGLEVQHRTSFEFPFFGQAGVRLSRFPVLGGMVLFEARKTRVV
jgi:glycosyltransferase involved in cell wall biosynthesis/2-polyprenyl-3-methyl-5-hydroxy-6-metoxy-1,4-benzoquinol methylase